MPAGDAFGDVMNSMPKYVVSTRLTTAAVWRNSTLIRGKKHFPDGRRMNLHLSEAKAVPSGVVYLRYTRA